MRRRLIDVALALAYAGLIFFLSSQSTLPVPQGIWTFDKAIHGLEYAVLSFLIARALRGVPFVAPLPSAAAWVPFVAGTLASLYGVSDECHQYFVPGRSADGYDMLADAVGAVLGAGVFAFHTRRSSRVKHGT